MSDTRSAGREAARSRPLISRAQARSGSAGFVQMYGFCAIAALAGLIAASGSGCGGGSSARPTSNEEVAAMSADQRPDGTGGAAEEGASCDFGGNHDRTCRGGLSCCYGPEYERTGYGACRAECPDR